MASLYLMCFGVLLLYGSAIATGGSLPAGRLASDAKVGSWSGLRAKKSPPKEYVASEALVDL
jgi:hypothetical protein